MQIYREGPSGNGVGVHDGDSYGIAGERFDISRTYYHKLGKKADCALESLRASERTMERVIALNKAFRERPVVALTCRGISPSNITAFAEEMWRVPNIANAFQRVEIRFFKLFFAAQGKYRVNSSEIQIFEGS